MTKEGEKIKSRVATPCLEKLPMGGERQLGQRFIVRAIYYASCYGQNPLKVMRAVVMHHLHHDCPAPGTYAQSCGRYYRAET